MKISPVLLFCVYMIAGLFATLWPFNFLQHNLATSAPGGGLVFKQPAIAFTRTPPIKLARLERFSLILRLVSPSARERACILDYSTDEHHVNFRLQQENDQLDVWAESAGTHPSAGLHIPHVFGHGDTVTIIVSYDGQRFHAWTTGGIRRTTQLGPGEHLHWDSTATLALGSLVDGQIGWRGTLFFLAVTEQPSESEQLPGPDSLRGNAILYYDFTRPFRDSVKDEGRIDPNPLWVPERYTVPSRIILAPPAHYNWHTRWFVSDMVLNIAAFFPFGFLAAIILIGKTGSVSKGIAATILAAFIFSLAVELLQAWLPTRNSSMVDLMCDVAGSGIGAWLAVVPGFRTALQRLGVTWTGQGVT
jgi:glycopeptide antibiotics resistance protein